MTRSLSLAEYAWLPEQVTGIDAAVLAKVSRLDLAESASTSASPRSEAEPASLRAEPRRQAGVAAGASLVSGHGLAAE